MSLRGGSKMEAVAFLENRQQYLSESPDAGGANNNGGAQGQQSASSIKIEALKELTLTLLKEVESLKDAQPQDGRRLNLHEEVRRFETEMIRWALKRTGGHQRRAARLLGLKVTTLHAKIKRYRIQINAFAEAESDTALEAAATTAGNSFNTGDTGDSGETGESNS
jgi:DNA-binding protein Fis